MDELFALSVPYGRKALQLAEENASDPAAFDALSWIVTGPFGYTEKGGPLIDAAYDLLTKRFSSDKRILPLCEGSRRFALSSKNPLELLKAVVDRNPSRHIRGAASLRLGDLLVEYAQQVDAFKDAEANSRDVPDIERISPQLRRYFSYADAAQFRSQAIAVYERAARECGNIKPFSDLTIAEITQGRLFGLRELVVGKSAPPLDGNDLQMNDVKAASYRGKVVVVVFWAGWWPRSTSIAAPLRDLVQRYNGKPFTVLGINADGSRDAAARVADQERMPWPSIFDGNSGRGPIATKWGIVIWPTIYVIDQSGIIRHVGSDASNLAPIIDGLLAVKK